MNATARVGLDHRDNRALIARAITNEGGEESVSVECLPPDQSLGTLTDSIVTVAVPDAEVAVKLLTLPHDHSIGLISRATFELEQCVLEPADKFQFDAFASSLKDRVIGLIYRRTLLEQMEQQLLNGDHETCATKFLMRAVALGRGYLKFAEPNSEGLLCVADLANQTVTLCFIYSSSIVAVGYMKLDLTEMISERSIRTFAVNLKSLFNYHITSCAQHGLTVPLSTVVMCGGMANPDIMDAMAAQFSSRLIIAQPGGQEVALGTADSALPFADFLVALGLTVN